MYIYKSVTKSYDLYKRHVPNVCGQINKTKENYLKKFQLLKKVP